MNQVEADEDRSVQSAQLSCTSGSVISMDGTEIGYRQLGCGPGLVILHGTMESSRSHMQLAEALADSFTVCIPDRRGRGLSGPFGPYYSLKSEVEDLDALLARTHANCVFGVSSGAIVSLEAAISLPAIHKAGIFEPPLSSDGSLWKTFLPRYDKEITQGNIAAALVTGMKAAQMGPAVFNIVPRRVIELLTEVMLKVEDKKTTPSDVTMRQLAPTLRFDFQLVAEAENTICRWPEIRAEVLLMGGSDSPAYLKSALTRLKTLLAGANRIEFEKVGHGASGNANRGGKPKLVAQELRRFFLDADNRDGSMENGL